MTTATKRATAAWGIDPMRSHSTGGNVVVVDLNALILGCEVAPHTARLIESMRECGHKIVIVSSLDETCRAWILETLANNNVLADDLFLRGTSTPLDLASEFRQVKQRMGDGWFKRVAFFVAGDFEIARHFAAVCVPCFVMIYEG